MSTTILQQKRLFDYAPAIGLITVLLLGMIAALTVILAALWIVAGFCFLLVSSIATTSQAIAVTFGQANPNMQLLVYLLLAYAVYRAILRKRGNNS